MFDTDKNREYTEFCYLVSTPHPPVSSVVSSVEDRERQICLPDGDRNDFPFKIWFPKLRG